MTTLNAQLPASSAKAHCYDEVHSEPRVCHRLPIKSSAPRLLLTLALLVATTGCTTAVTENNDADEDGFVAGEDCDDNNPAVHPESIEICDDKDNDCDGLVDEGDAFAARTWYPDADGDGFGDEANATTACSQPDGHTDLGGDCDDTEASTYPGASELCNTVDDDCNGLADVGGTDGNETDDDADGLSECQGDCDDADAFNVPGNEEVCDGFDN
ncbi:MAG TPA: hypothetical protein DIU15_17195, partial [Deltaproteobacteria bacterium]|nr:hypothetical protein [Deltaproteobacteria bacterium]